MQLISELGLRYRPSERADIEAHAARLVLLACDLADLPVEALRKAVDRWAVTKPFMPKACELVELAQGAALPVYATRADRVAASNAALAAKGNRRLRWIDEGGEFVAIDYRLWLERERPEQAAELTRREEAARLRAGAPE
jgi:hypothetical protein